MQKTIKYAQYILVACCIFFFFYLIRDFNSKELKDILSGLNYFWIIIAMFFCSINILFKTIRLNIISEQFHLNTDFKLSYKTQVLSLIFALLTPGRLGEVSKIYILSENKKENFPLVTNITLFEILIDFICIAYISLFFILFIMKNYLISAGIIFIILVAKSLIIFISRGSKYIGKLPAQLQKFLKYFSEKQVKLSHKMHLTILYTSAAWFLDGVFQYFILKSVGIEVNVFILVGLSAINTIMAIVSVLPLGLGVTDLSALFFYKSFLGLDTGHILFLVNSTRLFLILTLLIMAIPFFNAIFKREWSLNQEESQI